MQNNVTVNPLFHPGDHVGRYRVEGFLGQGAFAQVYQVTHLGLNAPRAVKLLRRDMPGVGSGDYHDCLLRFQLEAQLGAQLDHPHIIRVHDFEQADDTLLLVMEYAPGGSLADRLNAQGPLPSPAEATRWLLEAARGLAALHARDIIHRDVKPSNLLLDAEGRVKVADLGLAQVGGGQFSGRPELGSAAGMHPGTPNYRSPEHNGWEPLAPTSDVYSLGCAAFEWLTGKVWKLARRKAACVRDLRPDVPEWLDAIVMRMLPETPGLSVADAADPQKRYVDMEGVLKDVETASRAADAARQQREAEVARQQRAVADAARRQQEAEETARQQRAAEEAARRQQEAEETARRQREAEEAARQQREAAEAARQPQTSWTDLTGFPKPVRSGQALSLTRRMQVRRQREASLDRRLQLAVAGMVGLVLVILVIAALLRGGGDKSTKTSSPEPAISATMIMTTPIVVQEPTATPTVIPMHTSALTATPTHEPTLTPTATSSSLSKLGALWTRPADGMVMVYVPAGEFQMGSNDGNDDEKPVHTVRLEAFWMDRTEVTNAQYAKCVQAGACVASEYEDDATYNSATQPVVGVDWHNAVAYCAWAGGQLPTEAQWEYAARGSEELVYPWGNQAPTCELANYWGCVGEIAPVGSYPDGASWVGALDMAGNVWEWTADWYGAYPAGTQTNPTGPTSGDFKVVRGGSLNGNDGHVRTAYRSGLTPSDRLDVEGFRCIAVRRG